MNLEKGYIQLYTGNGKGKTTAALGLALRASGAGLSTLILQFMKGQHYSEIDAVKQFSPLITIEQYGSREFCRPDDENLPHHIELAQKGYSRARQSIADGNHALIILDEIVTAHLFHLISLNEIRQLIDLKNPSMELVLTGRGAPQELIDICDLVTEMKEIKHYYTKGVLSRKGIEN